MQISLGWFLVAAIVGGAVVGIAGRFYPRRSYTYYVNGRISSVSWVRYGVFGEEVTLPEMGYVRYYSTGAKSCDGFSEEPERNKYYSPDGVVISAKEWRHYAYRDLGTGAFASTRPKGQGNLAPLAKEFDVPP